MNQYILLNPGPACTTDAVKKAMLKVGDVCPREVETGDLMEEISNRIKSALCSKPDDYETILLASSGTGAVESVISSLPEYARVLNIVNGSYGQRIDNMLEVYDIDSKTLNFNEGVIDISKVEEELKNANYSSFTHISVIHCETTTGVINNIYEISELAMRYGCELIVDAMSSAFAYPIDVYRDVIEFLCCSSNKLVQGMAGIGIVLAKRTSLEKCKARTVYLDLKSQADYFTKTRQMRFTPPVQILSALVVALRELEIEGIENRYKRYQKLNLMIRSKMETLGFKPLIDKENNSIVITSFVEPERFDFEKFHAYLKDRGFVIYPGKVSKGKTFRLSNIGDIKEEDIIIFLNYVESYCKENC